MTNSKKRRPSRRNDIANSGEGKRDTSNRNGSRRDRYVKREPGEGRNQSRGARNIEETGSNVDSVHTNDISWWNRAKPLFDDATRLPFNRIQGDTFALSFPSVATVSDLTVPEAFPGIMVLRYVPSIGYAQNSNDPVNRAFTSIYGDIYSRTTGAMQFTQSDLALFVLGVSSIVQMIGVVKRALGVSQLYAARNYYYPRYLLTAMGFDPDSVIGHQDEIRRRINQSIQSVNAMRLPNFIDLFKRHYTLASNVWLDEDSPDAQIFVFVPDYYYAYDDVGSKLTATATALNGGDINLFLAKIESALGLWRNSSDLGLISGSIQRAYKDASLLTLEMVMLDEIVLPVYDKTMLKQINNAVILPTTGISSLDVTQDVVKNITKFEPKLLGSALGAVSKFLYGRNNVIINSFDGVDSADEVMEMTRLVTMGYYDGTDVALTHCGTELIIGADIRWARRSTPTAPPTLTSTSINGNYVYASDYSGLVPLQRIAALMSKFENGPRFEINQTTAPAPFNISQRDIHGDLYRWTTMDKAAYEGLQNAALQSIYVVNEITKPNNIR